MFLDSSFYHPSLLAMLAMAGGSCMPKKIQLASPNIFKSWSMGKCVLAHSIARLKREHPKNARQGLLGRQCKHWHASLLLWYIHSDTKEHNYKMNCWTQTFALQFFASYNNDSCQNQSVTEKNITKYNVKCQQYRHFPGSKPHPIRWGLLPNRFL